MNKNTYLIDENEDLTPATRILQKGGLVVFPTETVYGLGADACNISAVRSVFTAKGRPQDNPLIVHIYDIEMLSRVAKDVPLLATKLLKRFSPGPLTVVLQRGESIPSEVSAGLDTVAVRIPSHPVARELLRLSGLAIAAPSANISGRPSPTNFNMAKKDMMGRVDAIINGGECQVGLESTVIQITGDTVAILRPGAITKEMIEQATGAEVVISTHRPDSETRSPGVKYAHYRPEAEVWITDTVKPDDWARRFPGLKIGALAMESDMHCLKNYPEISAVTFKDREEYARNLYKCFHDFDEAGIDVIIARTVSEDGIGHALMNRLNKAGKILN